MAEIEIGQDFKSSTRKEIARGKERDGVKEKKMQSIMAIGGGRDESGGTERV